MGFTDRLVNAWRIFVTSLSFIGRDKSLLAVPIILILTTIVFGIVFFFMFFVSAKAAAALYANIIIFLFVMYFWSTFLGAAQSWMVHEVAQGKDTTLASGLKRALKNILDVLAFTTVLLLIKILLGALRRKGRLGQYAASFLDLIVGIAGKLVLPAMIITERNFIQAMGQLKDSIKAIPEIATFEVGIRPLTSLVFFISIGISVLFGLAFGITTGIIIFSLLFLAIIVLSTLINQIYYTLLYLTLIEKKKVHGLKLS